MNDSRNGYKIFSGVLLLIIMILGALLYQEKNEPLEDTLAQPTTELKECTDAIADWKSKHNVTNVTQASPEAQEELSAILDDCANVLN